MVTELRAFSHGVADGIPAYVYLGLIAALCIGAIYSQHRRLHGGVWGV